MGGLAGAGVEIAIIRIQATHKGGEIGKPGKARGAGWLGHRQQKKAGGRRLLDHLPRTE